MRIPKIMTSCAALAFLAAGAARADDSSGEIQVDAERIPNVRSLETALKDAGDQAGTVKLAQFLAVLPLKPADLTTMDAAYQNGLDVACPGGECTVDGAGTAARAPLDATSPDMRGVDVGVKEAIKGEFKVTQTDHGLVVNVCNTSGVYFAKAVFRKNLVNFQFVDTGDAVTARYELVGGVSGNITCR